MFYLRKRQRNLHILIVAKNINIKLFLLISQMIGFKSANSYAKERATDCRSLLFLLQQYSCTNQSRTKLFHRLPILKSLKFFLTHCLPWSQVSAAFLLQAARCLRQFVRPVCQCYRELLRIHRYCARKCRFSSNILVT